VFNMTADGRVVEVFDKVNLMPFGEYIPIVDPEWAQSYVPALSHNLAGEGPKRFEVQPAATPEAPDPGPPIQLGPLVCYEDIFPQFARKVAALGIHAFVNVTIDTWFGDTAEPWEHLALAQFRSVEHRIPMVRSVSTGVSTVVDHNGRIVAHLDVTDPSPKQPIPEQLIVHDVKLPRKTTERPTLFGRAGFVLPWLCQMLVLFVALAPIARSLYRRAPKEAASDRTEDE
jgi:apolipoprotein N-acyltransferase